MKNQNLASEPVAVYHSLMSNDLTSFIQRVRQGISFPVFSYIVGLMSFTWAEWASILHLSDRSMQRYKKEQKSFDALQSEKIIEISLLQKQGVEVFGSAPKFNSWLSTPLVSLGSKSPKSFLDSSFGIQLVSDELGRIAHGVMA